MKTILRLWRRERKNMRPLLKASATKDLDSAMVASTGNHLMNKDLNYFRNVIIQTNSMNLLQL